MLKCHPRGRDLIRAFEGKINTTLLGLFDSSLTSYTLLFQKLGIPERAVKSRDTLMNVLIGKSTINKVFNFLSSILSSICLDVLELNLYSNTFEI